MNKKSEAILLLKSIFKMIVKGSDRLYKVVELSMQCSEKLL